jgi:uncharacterized Tic20 family protein
MDNNELGSIESGRAESAAPTLSDRQWAAGAHLGALILALLTTWAVGIAGAIGALAVWMLKRDDSPFAAEHAKEALNFNLSMFIYACLAVVIAIVLVGATIFTLGLGIIFTVPAGIVLALAGAAIAVMWLVCSVIAAFKAYNGEHYRYPLSIRLVR